MALDRCVGGNAILPDETRGRLLTPPGVMEYWHCNAIQGFLDRTQEVVERVPQLYPQVAVTGQIQMGNPRTIETNRAWRAEPSRE